MKRYAMNRHEDCSPRHESMKHEMQDERKSEERKLNNLKRALQTKMQTGLDRRAAIRAA
jgi:hypothetical protein